MGPSRVVAGLALARSRPFVEWLYVRWLPADSSNGTEEEGEDICNVNKKAAHPSQAMSYLLSRG